jgi:hypothetical protein
MGDLQLSEDPQLKFKQRCSCSAAEIIFGPTNLSVQPLCEPAEKWELHYAGIGMVK